MARALVILSVATLLSGVIYLFGSSGPAGDRRGFLLEDSERHRWCAYGSEAEWNSAVKALSAMVVATVEYSADHVSEIRMTEEDETGDWIVYDTYQINDGEVVKVKRTTNLLPGDLSEEETYVVRKGKATKLSSTTRNLSTKEVLPSKDTKDLLPRIGLVTRLEDFPFASLVSAKHPNPATGSPDCVSAKPPQALKHDSTK